MAPNYEFLPHVINDTYQNDLKIVQEICLNKFTLIQNEKKKTGVSVYIILTLKFKDSLTISILLIKKMAHKSVYMQDFFTVTKL